MASGPDARSTDAARTQQTAAPAGYSILCPNCSASLPVDAGHGDVISCSYCDTRVVLASALCTNDDDAHGGPERDHAAQRSATRTRGYTLDILVLAASLTLAYFTHAASQASHAAQSETTLFDKLRKLGQFAGIDWPELPSAQNTSTYDCRCGLTIHRDRRDHQYRIGKQTELQTRADTALQPRPARSVTELAVACAPNRVIVASGRFVSAWSQDTGALVWNVRLPRPMLRTVDPRRRKQTFICREMTQNDNTVEIPLTRRRTLRLHRETGQPLAD